MVPIVNRVFAQFAGSWSSSNKRSASNEVVKAILYSDIQVLQAPMLRNAQASPFLEFVFSESLRASRLSFRPRFGSNRLNSHASSFISSILLGLTFVALSLISRALFSFSFIYETKNYLFQQTQNASYPAFH